jgi:hypothetical protein
MMSPLRRYERLGSRRYETWNAVRRLKNKYPAKPLNLAKVVLHEKIFAAAAYLRVIGISETSTITPSRTEPKETTLLEVIEHSSYQFTSFQNLTLFRLSSSFDDVAKNPMFFLQKL